MKNLVAIVGKPNVGKSTLFNKLIGKRVSIVHDEPGVTRDRLYYKIEWAGKKMEIIDTGGIEVENRPFQEQIQIQAKIAIEEADVLIFVVDGRNGITSDDELIVRILRRSGKVVLVAANKLEGNFDVDPSVWTMGFDNVFNISAAHGDGIGDLLDEVQKNLDFSEIHNSKGTKLAIIGRPNAGKSSLLNLFAGEERSIVSPIANTTRDSVNFDLKIGNEDFTIIDTAGINKKSKLVESVDHFALSRAIRTIEDSDITLMMIDAEREISHFDSVVGGYIYENLKPALIVVNKWDLITKETMTMKNMEDNLRKNFKFLSWAPVIFISALKNQRINQLTEAILRIKTNMAKRITSATINDVLADMQMMQPAPAHKGGRLQILFGKQIDAPIPTFALFVNKVDYLHFSYQRFIENQFREMFSFEGTPIRLLFRERNGDDNE